ncbi:hypothetical protein B0H10DRAFT_2016158 [Mycena sp. CBHHK59/15]|nr:hypothetical protein B0H10DRAFT_2016158 [Mycena sp. CBHHK59/15]
MFTPRSRDGPEDPYTSRPSMAQVPNDPHRAYVHHHSVPHNHAYSPVEEASHFGQRRFASGNPTARFQDHFEYSTPQGLPSIPPGGRMGEMSRLDTASQFPRADPQGGDRPVPISATSLEFSGDSETWSPTQPRPRKSRREKPRIELAPDQPPTTQGKPRARVYVACIQCRNRKIRCDGAKPICHNCGKRAGGGNDCNYDPLPKRRGPDKTPGARQRVARKILNETTDRRRRRNTSESKNYPPAHSGSGTQLPPFSFPSPTSSGGTHSPEEYTMSPHETRISSPYINMCVCHGLTHCPSQSDPGVLEHRIPGSQIPVPYDGSPLVSPLEEPVSRAYITEFDDNGDERQRNDATPIASQPSLDFSRKIWWDSLLSLYLSPTSMRLESFTASQRDLATQRIASDLRFLFRTSNYWFSFLHAPTFFSNFFDSSRRQQIQPSLILAALAMSTFWQSSEIELGCSGRERAMRFRDEAQSAMEASFNAGWVDDTLAQSAWILAMFEVCAHPNHSTDRSYSSMIMLDSIIRSLSLTTVDLDNPHTSTFSPGRVPAVRPSPGTLHNRCPTISYQNSPSLPLSNPERGCSCNSMTLGQQWAPAFEHTPLWAQTPAWSASWSESEIRKESCRRLCWSSMILAAGHSAYSSVSQGHNLDLFISDPSNYALLFSGEAVVTSPSASAKDTIWALYDRSTVAEKGQFAIKAWHEADTIEDALNRHTCTIERAFIFQGREYIFKSSANGLYYQHKAEEWLLHQGAVAQKFMTGLHTITGNSCNNLSRRPFYVFWFMAQVSRGLMLWHCDNSMIVALDVCKNLLAPIDYLTALWPCAEQRHRYEALRERLRDACDFAGIAHPPL